MLVPSLALGSVCKQSSCSPEQRAEERIVLAASLAISNIACNCSAAIKEVMSQPEQEALLRAAAASGLGDGYAMTALQDLGLQAPE